MEIKESNEPYVFQVDSELVKNIYNAKDNFLVSYNEKATDRSTCAIYFSSNDIYYPNSKEVFTERIVEKNFFEWYGTRIENVYKHILLRDVHKQWYLSGINKEVNSPEKLKDFLKEQTQGLSVITLGSSAGGYAAVLYGSLIGAKKAISFNGQFELVSLLDSSDSKTDPYVFRYRSLPRSRYYDIKPFINKEMDIYYFGSAKSTWDSEQYNHVREVNTLNALLFNTKHHGIPFLKSALNVVINMDVKKLKKYTTRKNNPVLFSIKMIGIIKTFQGAKKQLLYKYKKRN
ncbi:hypothetical protein [Ochrovirga pacifica]|uniref:hypothetical protein n=1 Tax=Ochrovirga pacifica TaxID=1042376 RepID=UPI0002559DFB|nr:hypothetical protein [Ochrovirga pacifica]